MLRPRGIHEPDIAQEVVTPAMLPPSAARLSMTYRGRSLFNEVLLAIKTRQRASTRSSCSGVFIFVYASVYVLEQSAR